MRGRQARSRCGWSDSRKRGLARLALIACSGAVLLAILGGSAASYAREAADIRVQPAAQSRSQVAFGSSAEPGAPPRGQTVLAQADPTRQVDLASAFARSAEARSELTRVMGAELRAKPLLAAIAALSDELSVARSRHAALSQTLAEHERGDFFALRRRADALAAQVADSTRRIYMAGWSPFSYWLNLLGASSLAEVSARRVYLRAILEGSASRLMEVREQLKRASAQDVDVALLRQEYAELGERMESLERELLVREEERRSALEQMGLPRSVFLVVSLSPAARAALDDLAAAGAVPGDPVRLLPPVEGEIVRYPSVSMPGIAIQSSLGDSVGAPGDGVVLWTGWAADLGRTVIIAHPGGVVTLLGTLGTIEVSPGDLVRAGERIGRVGMTGWSLAPHVHLELWRNGTPENPLAYF